jgi:hypothetical protein
MVAGKRKVEKRLSYFQPTKALSLDTERGKNVFVSTHHKKPRTIQVYDIMRIRK